MRIASFAAFVLMASTAYAQDIRPQEQARLDRYERTAGAALLEAMAGGAPADVAALGTALSGKAQVAFDPSLQGEWRCRTIRLGGAEQLAVYTNFKCRMALDNTGVSFEKLSGSQRTKGRITLRGGRAVYLGVGYHSSETPQDYADLATDFEGTETLTPDVAVFERVSPTRARLMFPAPINESDFDILELTR
ncbi:DUF4893 domain-containing protein [Sulfitobacter donghicola]|uniref:DUF4893 domain-containing protein n=1 Tax=Sulfitobacter donghicola DSW-25 = KCTC 12864 = JCM 14565 TaxID=1300350 RepID=A0A073ICK7_9RHOB|nr:DUF4893 domain-containing protein [Sulfitobacter donghicola]KEJ88033.1 hypothetical protein DSW25_17315 [Sulfitobacter donghicola DSW-25 = KCTC 12864 = JCM 14565]KIN68756.1 hypothetical protein Z948_2487 [Sulfitobacter donghicola DSW-25 = KCTC 12864 = JCM 14565]